MPPREASVRPGDRLVVSGAVDAEDGVRVSLARLGRGHARSASPILSVLVTNRPDRPGRHWTALYRHRRISAGRVCT
jgi:hypothetical protein